MSFRAAAYTKLENHNQAISDCKEALRIDPTYGKAYGRMGFVKLFFFLFIHFTPHITLVSSA